MDIKLNCFEAGHGFPLILLHGNSESCSYFVHQIGYFSKFYRVIAIDTRGHGASARGDGEFTLARFADDLLDFMDSSGIEKAHILGFSDGGNIAMLFALKNPNRVERLILNGANLFPKGVKLRYQFPCILQYHILRILGKNIKKQELLSLMVNEPDIKPENLKDLTMKTLVIAGTDDMIKKSHTELIYRSLPNADLVFMEGTHFIAGDNPKDFNRILKGWLDK